MAICGRKPNKGAIFQIGKDKRIKTLLLPVNSAMAKFEAKSHLSVALK